MNEDAYLDTFMEDRLSGGVADFGDYEPDLDFGFEHDSAMESIGWGDDDCAAYGGGEW